MLTRLPTYLLLGILSGWLNRHLQAVIEYLQTENEILKRQLNRPKAQIDERRAAAVSSEGESTWAKGAGRRGVHRNAGQDLGMAPPPNRLEMDVPAGSGRAAEGPSVKTALPASGKASIQKL
jgi:hypothetical protein